EFVGVDGPREVRQTGTTSAHGAGQAETRGAQVRVVVRDELADGLFEGPEASTRLNLFGQALHRSIGDVANRKAGVRPANVSGQHFHDRSSSSLGGGPPAEPR